MLMNMTISGICSYKHIIKLCVCMVFLAVNTLLYGAVIHVPADYPTIQLAIDVAVDGDEIVVAPGTYNEVINFNSRTIYLHSSDGPEVTMIDGTGFNSTVVVCANNNNPETRFEGFTVTGGIADSGGGMRIINSDPTIDNCTFSNNFANIYGGGLYCYYSNSTLTDCSFIDNIANRDHWQSSHGGAIFNEGGSLSISQCNFSGNRAFRNPNSEGSSASGGAIENKNSELYVSDSEFIENITDVWGGAIHTYDNDSFTVVIENCRFISNQAIGHDDIYDQVGYGGAISSRGNTSIIGCIFDSNSANKIYTAFSIGGAIRHSNGGYGNDYYLEVVDCSFINNSSYNGGGIGVFRSNLNVYNCMFYENESNSSGSAIYNEESYCAISNCLFTRNRKDAVVASDRGMTEVSDSLFTFNFNATPIASYSNGIALVENCYFVNNTDSGGRGGVITAFSGSALVMKNCFMYNNSALNGGSISLSDSQLLLANCVIANSYGTQNGGAVYMDNSLLEIVNSQFVNNISGLFSNTIFCDSENHAEPSTLNIYNSIIWDLPSQIENKDNSSITISYSDVRGGYTGTGNIDADPLFTDIETLNFKLQSGSPCIDRGNNDAVPGWLTYDAAGDSRFVNDPGMPDLGYGTAPLLDIGPYEFKNTSYASLSIVDTPIISGRNMEIIGMNAQPVSDTYVLFSVKGEGKTWIKQMNIEIDIKKPYILIGPLVTDNNGDFNEVVKVKLIARVIDVWFQYVQYEVASNIVATRVIP